MRKVLILLLGMLTFSAHAVESEMSPTSIIKIVHSYPADGEVVFTLENPTSICKGYWLKSDSPGQATTMSMILAAYHAKTNVKVWGYTEDGNQWPGSTSKYCKLHTIAYGYGL
ncbi:hypothetical protein [Microbulbifer variabilis]|uniref:hypothetical protein n=1 Tax=Microbulbifer variabilis TaxID=266805 RepID=UPI0003652A26|nr:hypothetical protein [Microbulbifer variabilis]